MHELKGSCHCGNVDFTLFTQKSVDDFVPRRCCCSMCRRHGASYISDPDGRLVLRYRDPSLLSVYKLGHGTAQWIVCSRCGVLTAVLCEIEDRLRAVVRVQSMVEHAFAAEVPTDFEAEAVAERLERRARTWIGTVEVSTPCWSDSTWAGMIANLGASEIRVAADFVSRSNCSGGASGGST